jgi:SAM-dependent methyltransferase
MDVLDLMSAWRSHVPQNSGLKSLVGLGMNAEEMAKNPQLTGFKVHDLNADPNLPFDDNSFDLVICTVSVEYLIHPEAIFEDVARVLRPNGTFVLTFSNRWFPPKVIHVWPSLHEFERMGLVLEYFFRSQKYYDLNTLSSMGWPRPESDKYYPQFLKSDPVYSVWGKTKS